MLELGNLDLSNDVKINNLSVAKFLLSTKLSYCCKKEPSTKRNGKRQSVAVLEDEYEASSKPQVCLLCTDLSLDFVTIQRYYHVRWNI
jgi:hypothetical protein